MSNLFDHNLQKLNILIADDDPTTLKLIESALKCFEHNIIVCRDGESAWSNLKSNNTPDIAILDFYMPGLTALEISQKHEALTNSNFIYKILLSGTLDKSTLLAALHNGFHDAIEKPIDKNLLLSRLQRGINVVIEKRAFEMLNIEIRKYATDMEHLARERSRQLAHAHRVSTLGTMSAGVAHEINNPMTFISGNIQGIRDYWNELVPIVEEHLKHNSDSSQKLEFILDSMPKTIDGIVNGVTRVTHIVKKLKRFAGNQKNDHNTFDVNEAIQKAIEVTKFDLKTININIRLCSDALLVLGNTIEIEQVLINLMSNASHAMADKSQKVLSIETQKKDSHAVITINDTGTGIPDSVLDHIWDPFFTTKSVGSGTGLGLSVSAGIIQDHRGVITASNLCGGGASFRIELPIVSSLNEPCSQGVK
jgi:two-component system, NtrC family, sensor kinase